MNPTVGRIVHYVAYGTPGGEYAAGAYRAAVITEVPPSKSSESNPAALVSICILSPTGLFFAQGVRQDPTGLQPGTWHWPERAE